MNIYVLTRIGMTGYDEYSDFVVAAETEQRARKLAQERDRTAGNESTWTDPTHSTCTAIGTALLFVSEGIVAYSFHAG